MQCGTNLPEPGDLFKDAVESFWKRIPPDERQALQKFQSKESMVQQLRSICKQHRDDSTLFACCAKITRFANSFAPYFDIINIFVQVKPQYMGIIWGSIRLIFQFGTNHTTFLEKVSDLFESLSFCLPRYQEHYETWRSRKFSNNDGLRIVKLLTLVYEDVVGFCGEIYLIFCRRSREHKLRHPLRLIRSTVWRPFGTRFSELQDRMRRHQELFDQEMQLQDQDMLAQLFEDFQIYLQQSEKMEMRQLEKERAKQKRLADEKLDQLRKWIWNLDHRSIYEHAAADRCPHSCDWFLGRSEYLSWRDAPFASTSVPQPNKSQGEHRPDFLSFQAKPGFGKTVLSTAIIEDLEKRPAPPGEGDTLVPVVAFFHFSECFRVGGKSSMDAFRALVAQLIRAHRSQDSVMDALFILFDKYSGAQEHASQDQVIAVLKLLVQQWPTVFIIDGIDECVDEARLLSNLWTNLHNIDCRVLLLSRPNVIFPYYYRALGDRWQIQLNPAENKSSIRVFLGNCFDIMACEGLFADVKISDALLDDVASRSDGMFLWARLLVNYLESPALSPHERLNVLQQAKLLEGLRGLYNRILLTMRASNPKQSQVAASIFKYVSGSVYPLSPTELHIALAIEPGRRTDDLYLLSNFPQCVRKITCALVDVNTDEGFNFIHLSLKEYLETDPECNVMFSLRDPADLHHFLAVRCLTHLLYDIPELPLRGLQREISLETHAVNMVSCGTEARLEHTLTPSESRTFIQKKFPFIKYAALCWLYHLLRFLSAQSASEIVLRDNRASVDDGKPSVRGDGYGVESHHRRRKRKRLAMDDDGSSGEEDSEYRTANAEALGCRRCLPVKPSAGEAPRSRAVGWITLLAQFLVRRLTVTTWVEASWSFGFRPLLTDLVPLVEDLCTSYSIDSLEGREIWWIHTGVRQLAAALEYLYRKYGPMMEANPTLIWQEHIKEMVDPNFWPCTQTTWSDRLEPFRGEGEVQQGFRPSRDIPPSVSIDHSLMHVS